MALDRHRSRNNNNSNKKKKKGKRKYTQKRKQCLITIQTRCFVDVAAVVVAGDACIITVAFVQASSLIQRVHSYPGLRASFGCSPYFHCVEQDLPWLTMREHCPQRIGVEEQWMVACSISFVLR
jgi:hypothetical protein